MQDDRFESWLLVVRGLSHRTVGARLSNCRRLEHYEGDLDEHFDRDGLTGLIDRLAYSTADENYRVPPRHNVPIEGNVYNGSATLKSAATLYKEFREGGTNEGQRIGTRRRRYRHRPRLDLQPPFPNQTNDAISHAVDSRAAFDLAATINAGESDRVEFKSSLRTNLHTKKKDQRMEIAVIKTIAAFLNTHGGTLIVGVRDDGHPLGIEVDEFASEDKMEQHLTNLVNSKIGPHAWRSISAWFDEYRGARLLVVQCNRSPSPVYVNEGETFYIRTGNTTNPLSAREGHEYIKAHFS